MTRINANIRPEHLIDQHLVAEYREIIRIPNAVAKIKKHGDRKYPKVFKLGGGHVLYFYDKIKYLHRRFLDLKQEMRNRVIANNIGDDMFVQFRDDAVRGIFYYHDIHNTEMQEANSLIVERIIERLYDMKRTPTINGEPVDKAEYSNMLRTYYNS